MLAKAKPKVNLYRILSDAVDSGVAVGLRRAYKYTESPTYEDIVESIVREVMNKLDEVIDFGN